MAETYLAELAQLASRLHLDPADLSAPRHHNQVVELILIRAVVDRQDKLEARLNAVENGYVAL